MLPSLSFSKQRPVETWGSSRVPGRERMFLLRLLGRALPHSSSGNKLSTPYLKDETYHPPQWASDIKLVPRTRLGLAILPTPVHKWALPGLPDGIEVFIKRDDLTGMQLSGNKVRKLEFLISEAKRRGHDSIVTIGGIQSNHCRATAVAARYAGLDCHLVLRTSRQVIDRDPGLTGNLLVSRMIGATLHMVTKEEYARAGSRKLGEAVAEKLRAQGKNPYLIPVGGSSALGTWGYLQASEELRQQISGMGITDVVMACGSGGTSAGLCLGMHLAAPSPPVAVHAYGVCDDPDYFYDYIDGLLSELGVWEGKGGTSNVPSARGLLRVVQARGAGYAMSTDAELQTVKEVAEATGIVLDPVYSGKAIHGLLAEFRSNPQTWQGRRVLFVHTGGLLGMYDKEDQLQQLLGGQKVERLQVAEPSGPSTKASQHGMMQ